MDTTYLLLPAFILAIVGCGWTEQMDKPTGNDIDDDMETLLKRLEDTLLASYLDKKELEDLKDVEEVKTTNRFIETDKRWWWTRLDNTKKKAGGKKGSKKGGKSR